MGSEALHGRDCRGSSSPRTWEMSVGQEQKILFASDSRFLVLCNFAFLLTKASRTLSAGEGQRASVVVAAEQRLQAGRGAAAPSRLGAASSCVTVLHKFSYTRFSAEETACCAIRMKAPWGPTGEGRLWRHLDSPAQELGLLLRTRPWPGGSSLHSVT